MKKAVILGISGQDGSYLSRFLLGRGYEVIGTSRDAQMSLFPNLVRLGTYDKVKLESVSLNDFRSVLQVIDKHKPDEVYNLAGQSSVGLSFDQPMETFESISMGTLNLLEVIRFLGEPIRVYNAASSECFGNTDGQAADESTPFRPRSPYAVAKARPRPFGKWPIIGRPTGFLHVRAFFSIMNHRSGPSALLQERS